MANSRALQALQVRPAKESDIQHLVVLEKKCFDACYYSEYQFRDLEFFSYLHTKNAILIVATFNSFLIGYVAGSVKTACSKSVAQLNSIGVSPAYRRKGIGDQLLRCFIEDVKNRACKKVLLQVAVDNEGGMVFFSGRGFLKTCYLPRYYSNRWDGVMMELKI